VALFNSLWAAGSDKSAPKEDPPIVVTGRLVDDLFGRPSRYAHRDGEGMNRGASSRRAGSPSGDELFDAYRQGVEDAMLEVDKKNHTNNYVDLLKRQRESDEAEAASRLAEAMQRAETARFKTIKTGTEVLCHAEQDKATSCVRKYRVDPTRCMRSVTDFSECVKREYKPLADPSQSQAT